MTNDFNDNKQDLTNIIESANNNINDNNMDTTNNNKANNQDEVDTSNNDIDSNNSIDSSSPEEVSAKPVDDFTALKSLINTIPKEDQVLFVNNFFSNFNKNDLREFFELYKIFVDNNGSINKTADELFLHKNTVQYRLNKAKDIMGYDPRNTKDMVLITLACILYEKNNMELDLDE